MGKKNSKNEGNTSSAPSLPPGVSAGSPTNSLGFEQLVEEVDRPTCVGKAIVARPDISKEDLLRRYREAIPIRNPYSVLFTPYFESKLRVKPVEPILLSWFPKNKYLEPNPVPAYTHARTDRDGEDQTQSLEQHTGLTVYLWKRTGEVSMLDASSQGTADVFFPGFSASDNTLVICHGWGESLQRYGHVANYFLATRPEITRVIGFDQVNHGRSPFYDSNTRQIPGRIGIAEHWTADLMEFLEYVNGIEVYAHAEGALAAMNAVDRLLKIYVGTVFQDFKESGIIVNNEQNGFKIHKLRMVLSSPALSVARFEDSCWMRNFVLPCVSNGYRNKSDCFDCVCGNGVVGLDSRTCDDLRRSQYEDELFRRYRNLKLGQGELCLAAAKDVAAADPGIYYPANLVELKELLEHVNAVYSKEADDYVVLDAMEDPEERLSKKIRDVGSWTENQPDDGSFVTPREGGEDGKRNKKKLDARVEIKKLERAPDLDDGLLSATSESQQEDTSSVVGAFSGSAEGHRLFNLDIALKIDSFSLASMLKHELAKMYSTTSTEYGTTKRTSDRTSSTSTTRADSTVSKGAGGSPVAVDKSRPSRSSMSHRGSDPGSGDSGFMWKSKAEPPLDTSSFTMETIRQDAKVLILHGKNDEVMKLSGSKILYERNEYLQLITIENGTHANHLGERWNNYLELANIWFRHVK